MKKEEARAKGLFGKCPYATAQQLLKGKWAIMIMHELEGGTKRFKQIQRDIDITQATLTNQLRYMEEEGLISRKLYPEVPPRVEYSLTEKGLSVNASTIYCFMSSPLLSKTLIIRSAHIQ